MGAAIAAANSGASTPTAPGSPIRASNTTSFSPPAPTTPSTATQANTDAVSHTTTVTTTSSSDSGRRDSGSIVDAYYYSVSLAKRTMGERLHSYAQLLTQILPKRKLSVFLICFICICYFTVFIVYAECKDKWNEQHLVKNCFFIPNLCRPLFVTEVDTIIEMVREATAECRNEGREIRYICCLLIFIFSMLCIIMRYESERGWLYFLIIVLTYRTLFCESFLIFQLTSTDPVWCPTARPLTNTSIPTRILSSILRYLLLPVICFLFMMSPCFHNLAGKYELYFVFARIRPIANHILSKRHFCDTTIHKLLSLL